MFFSFITFLCFFSTYLKLICIPLKSEKIDVIVVRTRDLFGWNSIFNPFCEEYKCLSLLVMGCFKKWLQIHRGNYLICKRYIYQALPNWIPGLRFFALIHDIGLDLYIWGNNSFLSIKTYRFIRYRAGDRVIEYDNNSLHHSF